MHSMSSRLFSVAQAILLNTTHLPDHHSFRSLQFCQILLFHNQSFTCISQDSLDKPCILFLSILGKLPLMLALEPVAWTLHRHNVLLLLILLLLLYLHQSSIKIILILYAFQLIKRTNHYHFHNLTSRKSCPSTHLLHLELATFCNLPDTPKFSLVPNLASHLSKFPPDSFFILNLLHQQLRRLIISKLSAYSSSIGMPSLNSPDKALYFLLYFIALLAPVSASALVP